MIPSLKVIPTTWLIAAPRLRKMAVSLRWRSAASPATSPMKTSTMPRIGTLKA